MMLNIIIIILIVMMMMMMMMMIIIKIAGNEKRLLFGKILMLQGLKSGDLKATFKVFFKCCKIWQVSYPLLSNDL